jgi:hypothetical protein
MSGHDSSPQSQTPPWPVRLVLRLLRWYVSVPLVLILAVAGLLCGYRAYRLSLLPPPSLPPAVEALLSQYPVPDDQNAHVDLQRAATKLSRFRGDRQELEEALEIGWHRASPNVRRHLSSNAEALELFLAGTEKPEYLQLPINELDFVTCIPDVGLTRGFVSLVQLDIARRISQADYSGAENELRQLLRFSVLVSRNGSEHSHGVGTGFQYFALQQLLDLIRDEHCPKMVIANLKQILIDTRRDIPPASQCMTIEYITWQQTSPEMRLDYLDSSALKDRPFRKTELFFMGHPELSDRVRHHHLAMLIPDADVPRRLRTREMNDPFWRRLPNTKDGVTGSELAQAYARSGGRLFHVKEFLDSYDRRLAFLKLAIIATALRQYRDDHGDFPAELQQLSPEYLSEVPINPRSPTGDSFSYRREESGCIVHWTGSDGIDESRWIDSHSMWARSPGKFGHDFGIRFGSIACDTADDF